MRSSLGLCLFLLFAAPVAAGGFPARPTTTAQTAKVLLGATFKNDSALEARFTAWKAKQPSAFRNRRVPVPGSSGHEQLLRQISDYKQMTSSTFKGMVINPGRRPPAAELTAWRKEAVDFDMRTAFLDAARSGKENASAVEKGAGPHTPPADYVKLPSSTLRALSAEVGFDKNSKSRFRIWRESLPFEARYPSKPDVYSNEARELSSGSLAGIAARAGIPKNKATNPAEVRRYAERYLAEKSLYTRFNAGDVAGESMAEAKVAKQVDIDSRPTQVPILRTNTVAALDWNKLTSVQRQQAEYAAMGWYETARNYTKQGQLVPANINAQLERYREVIDRMNRPFLTPSE